MSWLEWVAAGLGVINVALVVRRSVWNYPFGLAMVSLYFFVFFEARLYSDALLQIFFFVVQLYGWVNWVKARTAAGEVPVARLTSRARAGWILGTALASLFWGLGMARYTDAVAPIIDAFIAGTSISAQILMARRMIENWVAWVLVDVVATALYFSRGLYPTSALYLLFLLLSVAGLIGWRRALSAAQAGQAAPFA
jgi:nicotinamide mononucleotide transporter